jgi:hypothetical protein
MMVAQTVDTMLSHPDPLPSESAEPPDQADSDPAQPGTPSAAAQPDPEPDPGQPEPAAQQQPMNSPSAGFSLSDPQQGAIQ